jgi:hypothetical protein
VSPGLGLAVLFVLIGAQATRLAAPRRGAYLLLLVLSAAGVVGGEAWSAVTRLGGPSLGVTHPLADMIGVAGFEVVGALLTPRRRRVP